MERESMDYDVVIVGGGPSGLSAAIKLAQLFKESKQEKSICVLEKSAEIGGHILSGNVFQTTALDELIPDWKEKGAPLNVSVKRDVLKFLINDKLSVNFPSFIMPTMQNHGNYIISLANLCRWLAEQAETMGIDVFPGFPASELIFDGEEVKGVITSDMGVSENGDKKDSFQPGMEILANDYVILSEGCRGHLGKQVIKKFKLDEGKDPQHYGIGFKEIWEVDNDLFEEGLVAHTNGWPLPNDTPGGSYMYHAENKQILLGLIVPLDYSNPHLSPYDEFQKWKSHPDIKKYLKNGKRLSYGARALIKGGLQSMPSMEFPGGYLIGDNAGTLNFSKIKGSHTAMKSGIEAAKVINSNLNGEQKNFDEHLKTTWLYKELYQSRNFGPFFHKFGGFLGAAFNAIDQFIFRGNLPFTLNHPTPDHACLKKASECKKIDYPKYDNEITFDKLSSVYLSNTYHEEDQPCHLVLSDPNLPISHNLELYDEPAQRYCPAGVYEIVEEDGKKRFQINSQNCIHCKTCDIKEPSQNINWVAPEGGGGPNYPNM
ncbi:MAG: electron transfer flavoprotein-ubiquinone oxidoreductase, partial [Pseudomonadota bacterium]|jgi:electron-transferring-flavoprotein dehydrogenase|nr:electron transfer flavoprotein-ubiquinone oxidoreductase [Gammaproteobacteria bacterium]MEC7859322.1 electron transfer flavoprotein-ubiquinone oxidoreductase [Pseudomonadota bacterium]MEC8152967.1 electron transfer flavoprotein-ubiquinone oxidoreductase [Pseudomonadota bacterium]|tara:strand:+ start:4523 stop:6151 length:1629 start_codon:yes stop_codon:yes gene_type:complete